MRDDSDCRSWAVVTSWLRSLRVGWALTTALAVLFVSAVSLVSTAGVASATGSPFAWGAADPDGNVGNCGISWWLTDSVYTYGSNTYNTEQWDAEINCLLDFQPTPSEGGVPYGGTGCGSWTATPSGSNPSNWSTASGSGPEDVSLEGHAPIWSGWEVVDCGGATPFEEYNAVFASGGAGGACPDASAVTWADNCEQYGTLYGGSDGGYGSEPEPAGAELLNESQAVSWCENQGTSVSLLPDSETTRPHVSPCSGTAPPFTAGTSEQAISSSCGQVLCIGSDPVGGDFAGCNDDFTASAGYDMSCGPAGTIDGGTSAGCEYARGSSSGGTLNQTCWPGWLCWQGSACTGSFGSSSTIPAYSWLQEGSWPAIPEGEAWGDEVPGLPPPPAPSSGYCGMKVVGQGPKNDDGSGGFTQEVDYEVSMGLAAGYSYADVQMIADNGGTWSGAETPFDPYSKRSDSDNVYWGFTFTYDSTNQGSTGFNPEASITEVGDGITYGGDTAVYCTMAVGIVPIECSDTAPDCSPAGTGGGGSGPECNIPPPPQVSCSLSNLGNCLEAATIWALYPTPQAASGWCQVTTEFNNAVPFSYLAGIASTASTFVSDIQTGVTDGDACTTALSGTSGSITLPTIAVCSSGPEINGSGSAFSGLSGGMGIVRDVIGSLMVVGWLLAIWALIRRIIGNH